MMKEQETFDQLGKRIDRVDDDGYFFSASDYSEFLEWLEYWFSSERFLSEGVEERDS